LTQAVFLGGLLVVLVAGLVWALNPEYPSPDSNQSALSPSPTATPLTEETSAGVPGMPPTTQDAGLSAALIDAAPPPASTTVQVLDAGGGRQRLRSAVVALKTLGYQVVSTSSARQEVVRTTIWFTGGNEVSAQALQARDPRFAGIAPNAGLSARVDLHVLVGPDWQ
jgi:LytR cell envelope-related transcriptional attenuator